MLERIVSGGQSGVDRAALDVPIALGIAIGGWCPRGRLAANRCSADYVPPYTIFDVGGNKYRIVTAIHYNRRKVYIRHVLTHAEYDRWSVAYRRTKR